jgi:PAS domain S-box-containing protein
MEETVLILEDDRVIADRHKQLLEGAGYRVLGPAYTAEQALRIAEEHLPDLALLDVQIESDTNDDSGTEVGAELGKRHGTPVVYVTGHPESLLRDTAGRASTAGGIVLSKPVGSEELLATVNGILSDPVRKEMQHIFYHADYMVVSVNTAGVIQNANPAMETVLGYGRDELLGRNLSELVHGNDMPRVTEFLSHATTASHVRRFIEHRAITKTGDMRWTEWSVYVDRRDNVIYGIGRDTTERREHERHERALSLAFQNLGASVLIADARYLITFVNETWTRQMGHEPDEVMGRSLWDVMTEMGAPEEAQKELKETLERGEQWSGYLKRERDDGTVSWRQIVTAPITDPTGNDVRYVGVSLDVTELAEAREEVEAARLQVKEASDRKSRLIASLAHDMRTPLNVVLGYADLLASEERDSEKLDKIRRIRNSARFQLDLLQDVGDLSQLESGRMPVSRNAVSIRALLEATTALFESKAAERGIELGCEAATRVPRYLMLDDNHLKQALMNLLSNAFKFTDSGSVEVRADWEDGMLTLSVADSGPGIPEEARERIFEPFEQEEHGRSGSGLGLSIVREIVQAFGGSIEVESAVGQGTTFHLYLPCEPADSSETVNEAEMTFENYGDAPLHEDSWSDIDSLITKWRENVESNGLPPGIIDEALEVVKARAEEIAKARENSDTESLYRAAHDLKGMAANVHMDEVRRIAEETHALLKKTPANEAKAFDKAREIEALGRRLAGQEAAALSADEDPSVGGANVLLAEDNPANRDLFRAYLRRFGIAAEVATNGSEALDKLLSRDFSLAILDIEMPEVSGIDVAKRLREIRPESGTQLVAVTGNSYVRSAPELRQFDSYLVKPVSERELRLLVQYYCGS